MPQSKVKRKVGPKDTVRRAYEYDREQAEIAKERERASSRKRPSEGPTTSPVHLLPPGARETAREIKRKKQREANY